MKIKEIKTQIFEYHSLEELPEEDVKLILESRKAVKNSYAPYSGFHVSAAVLLENEVVINGTNQENAAYPSGLCAERVAIFYANSQYPDVPVKAIAVSAFTKSDYLKNPIPPCGSCRQVLLETEIRFKKPIRIILAGKNKIQVIENAKSLLPINFDEHFLD